MTPTRSTTKIRLYMRGYRKNLKWKEYHREYMRKWREKYGSHKDNIRRKVWRLLRNGELIKTPCNVCGAKEVEAHHTDYRTNKNIVWLCRKHHREEDVKAGRRKS